MGTPVRSDSFSSKGVLEPRAARSDSFSSKGLLEPRPARSESFSSKGVLEPRAARSDSFSSKGLLEPRPARSESFSSKGVLEPRPARSESFVKRGEPPRRSDSYSKAGGEPPRGRGYLSLSLKSTVFGLFLLCSCLFLLVRDVRYAPLVLRMFQEDQASVQHGHLIYHNATDHQVLQENSNQEFKVGNIHNSTSDEALADIDLSVEENLTVEEVWGESNLTSTDEPAPASDESSENEAIVDFDAAETEWDIPRAIPKTWTPPKRCATVEEMGQATEGDTRAASLRVRAMIHDWIAQHGARRVSKLAGSEFCEQGFVLGEAMEDGFGNNMYKVLTAAGLAVMLNRSLIIAERGGVNINYARRNPQRKPSFGDYLEFSEEAFTVREVRRLWAVHRCKRALVIHNDSLEKGFRRTSCLCDDWTALAAPILHFRGAIGSGAIQLLLKNAHPVMRRAAAQLLGNPAIPSSRPNTFGELFRAFIAPNADIREAVQWALKGGPDPDITLHLRMLHSRTNPAPRAASSCIDRIRRTLNPNQLTSKQRLRVVVVTDTPAIIPKLQRALGQSMEVVRFDYLAYAKQMTNRSEVMSLSYGVPQTTLRRRDWGEMPRWVAMVDFFLAARARSAVVSGAYRRVSTTYAQLVAALANANTLKSQSSCVYYSSLQSSLVSKGLATQSGWGHTWRPFGGKLGCYNQAAQCARTALLPYTWWDAPWQSPIGQDMSKLKGVAGIDPLGQVSERRMDQFCAEARRRGPLPSTKLQIPSYDDAIAEGAS